MTDYKILPSILAADHGRFIEDVKTVDLPTVDTLHIDVMDGHFVPNITFGPAVVASLKKHTNFKLDVHLMIDNVDARIPDFAKAGADIITIHQEATRHLHRSLNLIRSHSVKCGVALNPATPLETIRWVLEEVDLVLIMSVNPGFGGQSFIANAVEKIRELAEIRSEKNYNFVIEVDGGVSKKTAPLVQAAGANFLVAGSAVFGASDRRQAIEDIHQAIETAARKRRSLPV